MPRKSRKELPAWERVLASAAHLQQVFPDAVLVGGTASAIHAEHRISVDADHVVADLRERFDAVLGQLESVAGWKTARVQRPVQILGSLDGIETGVRQLIRTEPLETTSVSYRGQRIVIPTGQEMLRIKAVLILRRNATRDYLDFAALHEKLGNVRAIEAMLPFEKLYPQDSGESALQQLIIQLAKPAPYDLDTMQLSEYKHLIPRWQDWKAVSQACSAFSIMLLDALGHKSPPKSRPSPEI